MQTEIVPVAFAILKMAFMSYEYSKVKIIRYQVAYHLLMILVVCMIPK